VVVPDAERMDTSLALHTAARRYLIERRAEWISRYSALPGASGRSGAGYTVEARAIFPRYHVLDAIRVAVERLDPDDLPVTAELADALRAAAVDADDVMTARPNGDIEARAMDEERRLFWQWVDEVEVRRLEPEPLPYRRTLGDGEARTWWQRIEDRWPIEHGGWWAPIAAGAATDDALAIEDWRFLRVDDRPGVATLAVRVALAALGVDRVVEIREHGPSSFVDAQALEPIYTGAEGHFTAGVADWLVFASHEGVTALGGTIVPLFQQAWPGWLDGRANAAP
jgi:hypothetical protein